MTDESITLKLIPIGTGSSTETTATGIMQLFHPDQDVTQPLVVNNNLLRERFKVTILWATTLPASCSREVARKEGPRRPGDPPALVADARRAEKVLGWRPRFPDLDVIVETAWRWHEGREKSV